MRNETHFDYGIVLRRTKGFARVGTVSSMSPLIWIQPANLAGFFLPVAGKRVSRCAPRPLVPCRGSGRETLKSSPPPQAVVQKSPIDIGHEHRA